jgi:hypothetical protein
MDPFTISLIAGGVGTLADWALGSNPDTMTPEERRLYDYVWAELQKPDSALGYSQAEKQGLRTNLKTGISDYSQKQIGSAGSSLARRGLYSPGQVAGMTTNIMANAGKAYGQGINDINLASLQAGRQRKAQLLGTASGLTGRLQPEPDIGGGISDYLSQLAYFYAMKGKKQNSGSNEPSFSNISPPRWSYPGSPY